MTSDVIPFESAPPPPPVADEPTLIVDVAGFEGPLDLLLQLARQQKVDLTRISILALADQYLAFIEEARAHHLELAADYLVMAAWLAYLKSRLLIPAANDDGEGPTAAELAAALAFRLKRLEAFRAAAVSLTERPQLGRDIFARGMPQPVTAIKHPEWSATLYDLLSAYTTQRRKTVRSHVRFAQRTVWSLAFARETLQRLVGNTSTEWSRLDQYLIAYVVEPELQATAFASSLAATLELVREGAIELHQEGAFGPIYLRKRIAQNEMPADGGTAAPISPVQQ